MATKKKGKQVKKTHTKKRGARIWIFAAIGVFAVALIVLLVVGNVQNGQTTFDYTGQPYLGDKHAPVKIVEFGDYKCPYCKNFNETAFPDMQKDLVDTGKATFYFMNDPFIYTDSSRAALFAETVYHKLGNKVFWQFHDELYARQPDGAKYEQMDVYKPAFLEKTLKTVTNETNVNKVVKAFNAGTYKKGLKTDQSYVKKLGIQGTPAFYVNGKAFKGTTYDELIDMVNKAAKK
ncbi:thioredoxin [Pullulanibacillus camelliae]|uniref:Thioredoxin n=1 Tax=Pullulanibacillus camelliae TaxID=1707096 RepID=A0A8J2VLZ5_9BACL|nr:DsbA family protein [Pullulanibacillus camelliae]GGE31147.1 thioredoxin [Pullulanibacillus camelliae]